jgi:hypothetical protein
MGALNKFLPRLVCWLGDHVLAEILDAHQKLGLDVEDKTLIARPAGWVGEVSCEPQRTRPVQAAELAARSSLGAYDGAAKCCVSSYVSDKRLSN